LTDLTQLPLKYRKTAVLLQSTFRVRIAALFCDNDAGYCREEAICKGLDLSKNEVDDVTRSAAQEPMTSSAAAMSYGKYDDDTEKSHKLRRFCLSRGDRHSFAASSCRRLANCAGHVVSLRPCGDQHGGSDVTVSIATPHDRVLSSVADCRSFPSVLPTRVKPGPSSSLIQSPSVCPSSTAAAAAAAIQRRWFLEVLPSPPVHGYADVAAYDRNSTVSGNFDTAPSSSYAAASAAAVLSTQLAIQAWFRTALDARTSQLRHGADSRYTPHVEQDWVQRPPTSSVALALREVENSSSPDRPVDNVEEDSSASQMDETSRPASQLSHMEHTASELDDEQLQHSPSPEQTT